MKRNKTAGISLVALVVTIIVLIILTAAVIVTFMEGGIVDRAKEAVFKNDMRTYQEILAVKNAENQIENAVGTGEEELNASTLAEIQEIIPEFKEEYEGLISISNGEIVLGSIKKEPYTKWLADLGIGNGLSANAIVNYVEIGDYVAYSPDGNDVTSYELLYEDSGYFVDENGDMICDEGEEIEKQTIERQEINWRVLKNDGRQVTLISETSIDNIGLGGIKGFLNGPDKIDDIYEILYSGSKGIARNLKVEEVNEVLGVEIGVDVKQSYYDSDNNEIYLDKVATFGDAIDEANYDISGWSMPDDNYRNYKLDYSYLKSSLTDVGDTEKALIFSTSGQYWFSSTCVDVNFGEGGGYFRVYTGSSTRIDAIELCGFGLFGDFSSWELSGRPIVILNANVEISKMNTGDGSSATSAWQLN